MVGGRRCCWRLGEGPPERLITTWGGPSLVFWPARARALAERAGDPAGLLLAGLDTTGSPCSGLTART